jgi:hypothetical protein
MSAQVTGFRLALGFILIASVAGGAVSGGVSGAVTAFALGNPIATGAIFGAIMGGVIGWVAGSYAHGIGYTLLSINDHLESMATKLRADAPTMPPDATTKTIVEETILASTGSPAVASGSLVAEPQLSWRERFEKLPVDQSLEVKGLVVWKIKDKSGNVYYSGDKTYKTLDEVLKSYGVK